jgi:hypothetical protein
MGSVGGLRDWRQKAWHFWGFTGLERKRGGRRSQGESLHRAVGAKVRRLCAVASRGDNFLRVASRMEQHCQARRRRDPAWDAGGMLMAGDLAFFGASRPATSAGAKGAAAK